MTAICQSTLRCGFVQVRGPCADLPLQPVQIRNPSLTQALPRQSARFALHDALPTPVLWRDAELDAPHQLSRRLEDIIESLPGVLVEVVADGRDALEFCVPSPSKATLTAPRPLWSSVAVPCHLTRAAESVHGVFANRTFLDRDQGAKLLRHGVHVPEANPLTQPSKNITD